LTLGGPFCYPLKSLFPPKGDGAKLRLERIFMYIHDVIANLRAADIEQKTEIAQFTALLHMLRYELERLDARVHRLEGFEVSRETTDERKAGGYL